MRTMSNYRRVQTGGHEVDSEGSWAISYGDMITLLLSFFILFFNTNKHKASATSIQQALLAKLQSTLTQHKDGMPATEIAAPQAVGANDIKAQAQAAPSIDEELQKKLGAKVMAVGSKIIVEFPNVSFFKSGNTDLTKEGSKELKAFAEAFVPYAGLQRVVIRAYTDEKRVRVGEGIHRAFKNNMELSVLRAVSTARALQVGGVPLSRLMPGGFGEMRILANGTVDNSLARKVVLVVEPLPEEPKVESKGDTK
jgi:flagellar motor protein MotB